MGNRYLKFRNHDIPVKFYRFNTPGWCLKMIRMTNNGRFAVQGKSKKIFLGEDVYVVEKISKAEFCRRKRLHTKLSQNNCGCATYTEMHWNNEYFVGKMPRFDLDLFEYLKEEKINIPEMLDQLIPSLQNIHASGIYLQDIKPENIFVNIFEDDLQFVFADVDYAFMSTDFPQFADKRPWIRTIEFSPEMGKPRSKSQATRNDIYAIAVLVGRIETYYNHNEVYNIFCKAKGSIINRDFDDRHKINREFVYAEMCANFILTGVLYRHCIKSFLHRLQCADNYGI